MLARSLTHQHKRLDLVIGTPQMFDSVGLLRFAPALKRKSRLLKGSDLASEIHDPAPDAWSSTLADVWRRDAGRVRGLSQLTTPLEYPAPAEEFLGYVGSAPEWAPAGVGYWTHELVVLVSVSASVLLAEQAGVHVAARSEVSAAYEQSIGDEWTDLVRDVDATCRGQWLYEVPGGPDEQAQLRTWCERALGLEQKCLDLVGQTSAAREDPSKRPDNRPVEGV